MCRCSSTVERGFRKAEVLGSNPTIGFWQRQLSFRAKPLMGEVEKSYSMKNINKTNLTDTPKDILEIQYDLYRKMSPAKKFRIVCDAYRFGQSLAMTGIKMRYPTADKREVWRIWAKQHLG